MLPEKLSNGLCSLNPEVERLAMACDMLVDADGEVQAYQFFPAVIRSAARFTYTEVAAILANTRGPEAARRTELVPHLLDLHDVYRALLRARLKRGAIDFETTETQIVCDENGRIEKIVPRTRNEAHRLIEESMLAGQRLLGRLHRPRQAPGALSRPRGADAGEEDAAAELPEGARPGPVDRRRPDAGRIPGDRGGDQGAARRGADPPDAAALDAAGDLHEQEHRPLRPRLRGLHALHEPDPALSRPARAPRHQGAAREPALRDRRARRRRAGEEGAPRQGGEDGQERQGRDGRAAALVPGGELEAWEIAGAHCSANERRADEASRDVEAWLKCRYMREHLGEEFGGAVSAVTSFGLFVSSTASTSRGWSTSPSSAASTSASTKCARSCAASARGCATSSARGSRPGEPGRPRRPQDRLPHGPRRRGGGDRPARSARQGQRAQRRATSEIVALKDADRIVKAATKAKARTRSRAPSRPVRAGKTAVARARGRAPARAERRVADRCVRPAIQIHERKRRA
jgi:ribonuclease R